MGNKPTQELSEDRLNDVREQLEHVMEALDQRDAIEVSTAEFFDKLLVFVDDTFAHVLTGGDIPYPSISPTDQSGSTESRIFHLLFWGMTTMKGQKSSLTLQSIALIVQYHLGYRIPEHLTRLYMNADGGNLARVVSKTTRSFLTKYHFKDDGCDALLLWSRDVLLGVSPSIQPQNF